MVNFITTTLFINLRKGLFILFLLIQFGGCSTAQKNIPGSLIGHWEGTVNIMNQEMNVAFDFHKGKCTYDVVEMGIYFQEVEKYKLHDNGSFTIHLPGTPVIILNGKINDLIMEGHAKGKLSMNFSLKRTSSQPSYLREEEVQYESGKIVLSGTLIKPVGNGPFPAVVLLSGSAAQGKMTRERTRSMGYFFAKNGVAALIYDRQGNGRSKGVTDKIIPMNLLAEDAAAGAKFLATRTEINKNKIGFYGLSQGGWVAPYASSLFNTTAFIVVMSAPGISPDEQNRFASHNIVSGIIDKHLNNAGIPGDVMNTAYREKIIDDSVKIEREVIPGFSHFDPVPYWSLVTVPVLAIYGENDKVVPVEASKTHIEDALIKAGNNQYTFKTFPGANHQLKIQLNADPPVHVIARRSYETIAEWIRKHLLD